MLVLCICVCDNRMMHCANAHAHVSSVRCECTLFIVWAFGVWFGVWLAVALPLAQLRTRAQNGVTALIYAGYKGHADCALLLLDAGADKEAKSNVRASRLAALVGLFTRQNCFTY